MAVHRTSSKKTPIRAAIYLRISKSTEESTSLETQQREAQRLVKMRGWVCSKNDIYIDDGESASKETGQPAFKHLMNNLDKYDRVVTYKIDRFSRRLSNLANALDEMKKRGVALITVQDGVDTSTAQGRTFAEIFGAVAAAEARTTSERVKIAQMTLATQGRWKGGTPPYGWTPAKHSSGVGLRLVLVPEEARVLRLAIAQIIAGKGLGQTAKYLNQNKELAGRNGGSSVKKTPRRTGIPWTAQALKQTLRNKVLLGYLVYGQKVWRNKDTQEILVAHEPLVTLKEYEQIQMCLDAGANTRKWTNKPNMPTLLGSIAFCGRCGGKLQGTGATERHKSANYRCRTRYQLNQDCLGVTARGILLDAFVAEAVLAKLSDKKYLKSMSKAAAITKKAGGAGHDIRARLGFLKREMERLRNERRRGDWSYFGGELEWTKEYAKYAHEVNELSDADEPKNSEFVRLNVGMWLTEKDVRDYWNNSAIDGRRALIRAIIERVIVNPRRPEWTKREFDTGRIELIWRVNRDI
jgi:site-specific DNA recombinase